MAIVAEALDEGDGQIGIGVLVEAADHFCGVLRHADLAAGIAGVEQAEQRGAAMVVEPFIGLRQQPPAPVEGMSLRPRYRSVSFCTRRRHSSNFELASFTTWNGSATRTASGSTVSSTVR